MGRFTAGEFDWERRDERFDLVTAAEEWVAVASGQVAVAVGAGAYADTTTQPRATLLRSAELKLAVAEGLERRLMILSSRPEEGPPMEYIDLQALQNLIDDLRAQADKLLGPYRDSFEMAPGMAFAFDSTGVDETAIDEYLQLQHGDLEDHR